MADRNSFRRTNPADEVPVPEPAPMPTPVRKSILSRLKSRRSQNLRRVLLMLGPAVVLAAGLQAFHGDDELTEWAYQRWLARYGKQFLMPKLPPHALEIPTSQEIPSGLLAPVINGSSWLKGLDHRVAIDRAKLENGTGSD